MAVTTNKPVLPHLRPVALALALAGLAGAAHAADFRFSPRVELRHTYSDNIRLAPPGSEVPGHYTELRPGFSLRMNGRRVRANADYSASLVHYDRGSLGNKTLHHFSGEAGMEVIEDWLFLEGRGAVGQQVVDPFGPVVIDDRLPYASDNLAEVRSYQVTPYVRHRFGSDASLEARYTREGSSSSSDVLADTETERATVVLSSGQGSRKIGWGLLYNDETTDYASSGKVGITTYFGSLKYFYSSDLAFTATGGHEKYGYLSLANRAEGNFWTLGFGWRPSPRTSLEFSGGRRFFGDTYSLSFNHRSRRTAWQVSYNEDITTTQQQFQIGRALNTALFLDRLWANAIPDERVRRDAVMAFIRDTGLPMSITTGVSTFTNRFFLQKALQGSMAVRGRRDTVMLNVFNSLKRATSGLNIDVALFGESGSFVDTRDLRQVGLQGLWRHALTRDTALNTSFSHINLRSGSAQRENIVRNARVALSHQFSRNLSGEIELRKMRQSSNRADGHFRDNAVAVSLRAAL